MSFSIPKLFYNYNLTMDVLSFFPKEKRKKILSINKSWKRACDQFETISKRSPSSIRITHKPDDNQSLIVGINRGKAEVVSFLLKKRGVSPDILDKEGRSALSLAVERDDNAIVMALIEAACKIDLRSANTLLRRAVGREQYELVPILLEALDHLKDKEGASSLAYVMSDHADMLGLLGEKLLVEAVEGGNIRLAQVLMNSGIDPEIQGNELGNIFSLLSSAIENIDDTPNGADIVVALIRGGANVNFQNVVAETPIFYEEVYNYLPVVRALIDAGADLNLRDVNGSSPLFQPARMGYIDVVQMMIWAGADLNIQNNDGDTALMVAIYNEQYGIARALIDAGTNLNLKNRGEMTALIYAAREGNVEVVQSLVDRGVNLDAQDSLGVTALMGATLENHQPVIRLLLEAGASSSIIDNAGFTAIEHAATLGGHVRESFQDILNLISRRRVLAMEVLDQILSLPIAIANIAALYV